MVFLRSSAIAFTGPSLVGGASAADRHDVDTTSHRRPQPRPRHLQLTMGSVRMHRLDIAAVTDQVTTALEERSESPLAIGSVNLDHVFHFGVLGTSAPGYGDLQWLMLIDGAPVAKRARKHTAAPWPRLTGADLLPDLLTKAEALGARVGFLGGSADTSRALRTRLAARWPHLAVAGIWTPPRDVVDDVASSEELAAQIADAGVDVLIVGLGKPRQERWIARHGVATGAPVLTAFGAAASFIAGTERRAPRWMRRAGVEWAYRLVANPRRLWRRYLVQGPRALAEMRRTPVSIEYVTHP